MRVSICFGLALLFLSTSTNSVLAEPPQKHSKITSYFYNELINFEKSVSAIVDDEDLQQTICPKGESPCTVDIKTLPETRSPCDSQDADGHTPSLYIDHFYIHEIDCGADGVPDLMIEYECRCISSSRSDDYRIKYLIYRDTHKKFHITKKIVDTENQPFAIDDESFYTIDSACGTECHASEMGFLGKQCQLNPLYTYKLDATDNHTPTLENEHGKLHLANLSIQDKAYYRIVGNIDEKEADELILSTRKASHARVPMTIELWDTILTSAEQKQKLEKAKESYLPTKPAQLKTNKQIEVRLCGTCGNSYDFVPKGERCPIYNCVPRFDIFRDL